MPLRWWERAGVIHAHPSNLISHTAGLPILALFLRRHEIVPAVAFGGFPMFITVLWTYFGWRDKPSLSRTEQFLYERSTRLNVVLTVIGVFAFSYGPWTRSRPLLTAVTLGTLLLASVGVTRNPKRRSSPE